MAFRRVVQKTIVARQRSASTAVAVRPVNAILRQVAPATVPLSPYSGLVRRLAPTAHPIATQRANPAVYVTTHRGQFGQYGTPPYYGQGMDDPDMFFGDYSGISLKGIGRAVKKAVKDIGHETGRFATSKIGKAVVGGALALTGVGIPAAAAIGAATQAGGQLIKPGGNLGKAGRGAVTGAVIGGAAGVAGKFLPKLPVVGKAVTSLRRRIGTAPKEVFESDARLDALASGKIPDVALTPSQSGDVLKSGSDQAVAYQQAASDAIALANQARTPQEAESWRAKAAEFMRKAREVFQQAQGVVAVNNGTIAPSSNEISPTGGFPVSTSDQSTTEIVGTPMQAGMGFNVPAPLLLAIGAAFLLSQRRR